MAQKILFCQLIKKRMTILSKTRNVSNCNTCRSWVWNGRQKLHSSLLSSFWHRLLDYFDRCQPVEEKMSQCVLYHDTKMLTQCLRFSSNIEQYLLSLRPARHLLTVFVQSEGNEVGRRILLLLDESDAAMTNPAVLLQFHAHTNVIQLDGSIACIQLAFGTEL